MKYQPTLHSTVAALAAITALPFTPATAGQRPHDAAPIPRPQTPGESQRPAPQPPGPPEIRSIDGQNNNVANPTWGSASTEFLRITEPVYADGVDSPAGSDRPGARAVSNAVMAQTKSIPNSRGASDFLWQWGQFLDHDITETPTASPAEAFNVPVPNGDPEFDPAASGTQVIPLNRSLGREVVGIREQVNAITGFIDASNVYGSSDELAAELRSLDGTGHLRTSDGDLLPLTESGFFIAGDSRVNEQIGLISMHTLFMREHNFWADWIRAAEPTLDGDAIYQRARQIVGAELQAITYREFLPLLLGPSALLPYRGYDAAVNPGITNEFSAAAYRFGHSTLSPTLQRINATGEPIAEGPIALADAFFVPSEVIATGIDPILRGLAAQRCQELDHYVVDDLRNFLFGAPGSGGFDLASLNIQRGRDHGLADYSGFREAIGLAPVSDFTEINPDTSVSSALASVYESVDQIDLWLGGLAEQHAPGAMVGPTFRAVLVDQFERLRSGDRFWYEHALPGDLVRLVNEQTLARIIRRNTAIGTELSENVFVVASPVVDRPAPPRANVGNGEITTARDQLRKQRKARRLRKQKARQRRQARRERRQAAE